MVARAWAWLDSRDYVTPDDLQALAIPVWQHRFVMKAVEWEEGPALLRA